MQLEGVTRHYDEYLDFIAEPRLTTRTVDGPPLATHVIARPAPWIRDRPPPAMPGMIRRLRR